MLPISRLFGVAAFLAILAGCATQSTAPAGPTGKHLVYRDGNGVVLREFEYPDDGFCRRVEAVAKRSARCQAEPTPGMLAKATLRYNPPGVLVQGRYADMARCRAETTVMSPGVELVDPCKDQ